MDCKFNVMTLSVNKPIRNKTEFCLKKRCTPQMWYHAGLVYLYLATVVWAWRVTLRHRIKWWSLPVCNIFLLGFLSIQLERVICIKNCSHRYCLSNKEYILVINRYNNTKMKNTIVWKYNRKSTGARKMDLSRRQTPVKSRRIDVYIYV